MKIKLIVLPFLFSSIALAALPDFGEPFKTEISFSSIWNKFMDGNFDQAWRMLNNEVYRRAKEAWNDEKTWANVAKWGGEKLQDILDNPNKTNQEKGAEIANLIADSVEPYSTQESSDLNIKVEHSIMFETTIISWNDLIKTDECEYFYWKRFYSGTEFWDEWTVGQDYLVQVPDYNIYRVVNGIDILITKIKGKQYITPNRLTIGGNDYGWKDTLSDSYNYKEAHDKYYKRFGAERNRLVFEDLLAGDRNQGETLSYKIVADNSAYDGKYCGYQDSWVGVVNADSNGDRKMDYIPTEVYDSIWIRQSPWFVPVITTMLF